MSRGGGVVVQRSFGRDPAPASNPGRMRRNLFPAEGALRIDRHLGKGPLENLHDFRSANSFREAIGNRTCLDSVQATVAEEFGVPGVCAATGRSERCAMSRRITCCRWASTS